MGFFESLFGDRPSPKPPAPPTIFGPGDVVLLDATDALNPKAAKLHNCEAEIISGPKAMPTPMGFRECYVVKTRYGEWQASSNALKPLPDPNRVLEDWSGCPWKPKGIKS